MSHVKQMKSMQKKIYHTDTRTRRTHSGTQNKTLSIYLYIFMQIATTKSKNDGQNMKQKTIAQ